jgi:hypothetical protein
MTIPYESVKRAPTEAATITQWECGIAWQCSLNAAHPRDDDSPVGKSPHAVPATTTDARLDGLRVAFRRHRLRSVTKLRSV